MTALAMTRQRAAGFLPMIAVTLFWGFNWPVVRILLATCSPWTLRAAGLSGGALILFAAAKLTGTPLTIPRRYWREVMIASVLNIATFNICVVFAQLSMPTSRAAILTFTMPLWSSLFAWALLGEAIDRRRLAALAVGVAGLGVLSAPFMAVIAQGGVPFGLVYVLVAAMSWALGTVYMKGHKVDAPPLAITAWQVAFAAVLCTVAMAVVETPRLDLSKWPQLSAFVYHIFLAQGLAYLLWFNVLGRLPAATASIGTLLTPVFGVVGSVLLLGDWPTRLDVAGLGLIICAVLIDQLRPSQSR